MTNSSLNQEQLVFILSLLSNGVASIKDTQKNLQERLTKQVTDALADETVRDYIGEWDVVWGPVVYKDPLAEYATNSMYVAQSGNQYVVAIAGTDPSSVDDWVFEDGFIMSQVNWPYGNSQALEPKISQGAYNGLHILQNKMRSSGKTLLEFLGEVMSNPSGETEIIFTGHSLGGTLSPTLALAALDRQNQWSNGNPFQISVCASAGPTPGNSDFSIYYGEQLGDSTTRIWNKLDTVPHTWNEDMLSKIPNLYEPEIKSDFLINFLIDSAKFLARNGNYTHILPNSPGLNGTVVDLSKAPDLCNNGSSSKSTLTTKDTKDIGAEFLELLKWDFAENPYLERTIREIINSSVDFLDDMQLFGSSLTSFLNQVIYQHVQEYIILLDIKEPYCYLQENNYLGNLTGSPSPSKVKNLGVKLLKTSSHRLGMQLLER